jgi:UDP:flavonoid glycosyltransferase YjiC (YdhE family)
MFPRLFGAVAAPAMLADLLPLARAWQPDLLVHDAGELAAPLVAALLDVPQVNHGFGCLLPAERVAAAGEWVAPLWEDHGLEPRPYAGMYGGLYLDIYPPTLSPGGRDHVPRVQPLRPVAFDATTHDVVPDWLGARSTDRPLVYVTFGTVFNPSTAFVAAIEGIAALDVDVVATVGPNGDPAALGPVPANVRVERYVPQTKLLPRCAVAVSHAGSGTFLGCLANGLPQLCLPQAADQFLNAAAGARTGAALALPPGAADAESIRAAVRRLLEEPSFAEAARTMTAELDAMPSPADVAVVLEELAP